jgi:predicted house-cleaning NTP pyrophosphatase (Maf/HAM1 superfamily)
MGLPVYETAQLLSQAGIRMFWKQKIQNW